MQTIIKFIDRVKIQFYRLKMSKTQKILYQIKGNQLIAFNHLKKQFSEIYNKLRKYDISRFITPYWKKNSIHIEEAFLPCPSISFLRDPIIINTMFVTAGGKWLKEELRFLEKRIIKNKLKGLLQEDYVGDPLLLNSTYFTSHNSIHHLYHFINYLTKTKRKLDQLKIVVEWGGGYGNMAKILKRVKSTPFTYIIIDLPIFSCIQWLYLSSILGKEKVNILQNPDDVIEIEKINILPICFIKNYEINADLFISTWALSESSKYSQDYVINHNWFNSKYFLLSCEEGAFFNSDKMRKMALNKGAIIENIKFLPRNYYIFC